MTLLSTNTTFAKRLVDQESSVSSRRAAGVGIGVTGVYAGAAKSPLLARSLRIAGAATLDPSKQARFSRMAARQATESARVSRATAAVRGLGFGIPTDAVPKRWRPVVGVLGGGALLSRSLPIRHTTTRPVVLRYPNTQGA